MHRDLELATRGRVHVLGELREVLGVEVGGRVGGGKVPLGLGKAAGGAERKHDGGGGKQATLHGEGLLEQAG